MEEHIHEELVVVESDTIGDPGAMMVHFGNTLHTNRTVMSYRRFNSITSLAISVDYSVSKIFELFREPIIILNTHINAPC